MKHWSSAYLGQPWQKRGRERGGIDCLGLARLALAEQGVASLPVFGDIICDQEFADRAVVPWIPIPLSKIRDHDILVFGRNGIEDHIGVVAGGQMLHIEADGESCVEPFNTEKFARRFIGAYRYATGEGIRQFRKPDPHRVLVLGLSLFDPARDTVPKYAPPGLNLAEVVTLAYPLATDHQKEGFRVAVGRIVVPPEMWGVVRPRAGSVVTVQPLPGFNWKALLAVGLAAAATAAGQAWAVPLVGSLGLSFGSAAAANLAVGIAGAAITGGIMVAGSALLGALGGGAGGGSAKQVYSIQGWTNDVRPDAPFPFLFGKRRDPPVQIARPYITVGFPDDDNVELARTTFLTALFCEGIIGPTTNLVLSEQRIGDTEIAEFYGQGEDDTIEVETIDWYPGDPPPTLYPAQVVPADEIGAVLDRRDGDPLEPVTRVAAGNAKQLEVIIRFSQGLVEFDADNEAQDATAEFKVEQQAIGSGVWETVIENWSVTAKRYEMFWVSRKWEAVGDYRVRITRLDEYNPSSATRQSATWEALYSHRDESPLTSMVPIKVTAIRVRASKQLQGTLDAYNRVASRTCPDWDEPSESWIVRETANHASCFRLACQGPQLMTPKPDSKLDLARLQEWHGDIAGWGLEFNYELTEQTTLPDLLQFIAQPARASRHHDGKKWGVVIDKATDIINGGIGAHNVVEGSFSKQVDIIGQKMADAVKVTFYDEEQDYKRAERIVNRPGLVGNPVTFTSIDLPWETNAGRAWVEATRQMLRKQYHPRTITCSQDWEQMARARNDRVLANHPVLDPNHVSARTRSSGTVTLLELDTEVEMEGGQSYAVTVFHVRDEADETADSPAIEAVSRTLTTVPGKTKTLILNAPVDVSYGDMVFFGGSVDARITAITAADMEGAQLVLEDYSEAYYDAVDALVAPAWDGDGGEVPDSGAVPPALSASYLFNIVAGELRGYGRFFWTGVPGTAYQVGYRKVGTTLVSIIDTSAGASEAVTAMLPAADNYEGRVRVQGSSLWSGWVLVPSVTVHLADDDTLSLADDGTLELAD